MSDLVVAILADRAGNSERGFCPSGSFGLLLGMDSATVSDGCGVLDSSDLSVPFPVAAAAAAAAACCWAMSFLDAFPRFLRSRMYSQVKPNSGVWLVKLSDVDSPRVARYKQQR